MINNFDILFIAAFVSPQANIHLYHFLPVSMATAVAVEFLSVFTMSRTNQLLLTECFHLSRGVVSVLLVTSLVV